MEVAGLYPFSWEVNQYRSWLLQRWQTAEVDVAGGAFGTPRTLYVQSGHTGDGSFRAKIPEVRVLLRIEIQRHFCIQSPTFSNKTCHQTYTFPTMSGAAWRSINIAGYMACSSLMLIINKLAVVHLPSPGTVLFCQLFTAAATCRVMTMTNHLDAEPLKLENISKFWAVPAAFLLTVFANIKILQHANVETFIVFRSSTPMLVSLAEFVFLGRELPSAKNAAALLAICVGAGGYVVTDNNLSVDAYLWVAVWYVIFAFDQIYIKHKLDTVEMTTWTRVYYTNALAGAAIAVVLVCLQEPARLVNFDWTPSSWLWLATSCVMSIGIAYFSFAARSAVSATYFTVIGNFCKILTVAINVVIWDKHASPAGMLCLACAMGAAYLYEQAPLRSNEDSWEHCARAFGVCLNNKDQTASAMDIDLVDKRLGHL
jgi:GDP-mannose transporter